MDSVGFNHKFPSSSHGTRSTISGNNNNDDDDDENHFTLASNRARMGRRFSSIETNGNCSSGSSDINNWSNEVAAAAISASGEIRTRNSTANQRREHEINYRRDFDDDHRHNQREYRHHRWTSVNSASVEKLPTKSYVIDKNGGLNHNHFVSTNNINDTHSTNSNGGDKAKWTHKTPIHGNITV